MRTPATIRFTATLLRPAEARACLTACAVTAILAGAVMPPAASAQVTFVSRIEFTCGDSDATFQVQRRDAPQRELRVESVLTVTRGEAATVLRYRGGVDFIGGACVPDAQGRPQVAYQAYCGGSGCDAESNWGIIDASTLRVLLVPRDGNVDQAREILGVDVPALDRLISIRREDR